MEQRDAGDEDVVDDTGHNPGQPAIGARSAGESPLAKQRPMTMAWALMAMENSAPVREQTAFAPKLDST